MKFNYSLDETSYTWKNALLWGNFAQHSKKAREGKLSNRVIHAFIAAIEFLPIISQISSICEKLIIDKFSSNPKSKPQSLTEKKIILKTLNVLDEKNLNLPIPFNSIPNKVKYYSENAIFYGYNAEGIRDYGWGCAWRAIQTCLSPYKINPSFEDIFHLFGPLENLKNIYEDKYPTEELPNTKPFAPHDLTSGWAEPFIGHMVMHYYNIPSALELLNGIPGNCHAPEEVFHQEPIIFNIFKANLEHHFKTENPAPVMIDDGMYALNIVGIENEGLNTTLWIADPHIKEGVNKVIDQEKSPSGLYKITLDEEGKQINCSLNNEDKHQVAHLFSAGSYKGLHFESKRWMVLFPLSNAIK